MGTARLVIAGTSSGVGKTTLVVGLTRAFQRQGLKVATFKCGPDYLDPTYHARAAGVPSQNLDGWMMGRDAVRATFARASRAADVSLIEGVMGLFDGASPTSDSGSTAEIARWLDAPVVLVVDASGMARSYAALVRGFAEFDPELAFAGSIANRVGSAGHLDLLRRALPKPPIFGGLTKAAELAFPERHLGLSTADEQTLPEHVVERWADEVSAQCDVAHLLELARHAPELALDDDAKPVLASRSCRIGVAHDAAFHFYYEDNLRRLEQHGAELVRFSPIADERVPDVDGVYLGGGYPELFARELSQNQGFLRSLRAFCARGRPVYAECGGLMYLCQAIETVSGERFEMAGVLPGSARMFPRLQALGYVEVETQRASLLGPAGTRFRGHQFRYSELQGLPPLDEPLYKLRRRRGDQTNSEGYTARNVVGSYVHAHWASNPMVAAAFVKACEHE